MEELTEKRVWQRVHGEPERVELLRRLLADQGRAWGTYRALSRRGGGWRRLLERKEEQLACLRGLLRVLTGQGAAHPKWSGGPLDLSACLDTERRLLAELTQLSRDSDWGPVFQVLRDRQSHLCRLLLELLGTM